jgi:hypothetical protein
VLCMLLPCLCTSWLPCKHASLVSQKQCDTMSYQDRRHLSTSSLTACGAAAGAGAKAVSLLLKELVSWLLWGLPSQPGLRHTNWVAA